MNNLFWMVVDKIREFDYSVELFALVIASMGFFYSIWQSKKSDKQTRHHNRARLFISPENIDGWIVGEKPKPDDGPQLRSFIPQFKITNAGNTPAEEVCFDSKFVIAKAKAPADENWEAFLMKKSVRKMATDVPLSFSTGQSFSTKDNLYFRQQQFNAERMADLGNMLGKDLLYYIGFVKFKDIYGDVWIRSFRWTFLMMNNAAVCHLTVAFEKEWRYRHEKKLVKAVKAHTLANRKKPWPPAPSDFMKDD